MLYGEYIEQHQISCEEHCDENASEREEASFSIRHNHDYLEYTKVIVPVSGMMFKPQIGSVGKGRPQIKSLLLSFQEESDISFVSENIDKTDLVLSEELPPRRTVSDSNHRKCHFL